MVAHNKGRNVKQGSMGDQLKDAMNEQSQDQGSVMGDFSNQDSGMGGSAQEPLVTTSNILDLISEDLTGRMDGAGGINSSKVMEELKKYRNDEGVNKMWQFDVIQNPELPNGEMLAIYLILEDKAFVHPVFFAEKGGRVVTTSDGDNNMMGNVRESRNSSAVIAKIGGFKNILVNYLNTKGFTKIATVEQVYISGAMLYHAGSEIKPNNLIGNACAEIIAVAAAISNSANPNTVQVSNYKGCEILVDSTTSADRRSIMDQHIFTPVVITGQARSKSTLSGSNSFHNTTIGELGGYMDFAPFPQEARQAEILKRQHAGQVQRVPNFKPFYVIKDIAWAAYQGKHATPENLMSLLMLAPSIADGGLWVPRVVNAQGAGFNPIYDFASVGYDDPDFGKAFDECHVPSKFDLNAMRRYSQDYFSNTSVCIDIPLSGPLAGMLTMLTDATQLNRLIQNQTGISANFAALGNTLGRFPVGTYDFQGKKRDISELLNYYSWAKYCNGDKQQMQRYHQWFLGNSGNTNEDVVFSERLKMAEEISGGTFELLDTCTRVAVNDNILKGIRKAFTDAGIIVKLAQNATNAQSYGFMGGFNDGMSIDQNQQQGGMFGNAMGGGNVW